MLWFCFAFAAFRGFVCRLRCLNFFLPTVILGLRRWGVTPWPFALPYGAQCRIRCAASPPRPRFHRSRALCRPMPAPTLASTLATRKCRMSRTCRSCSRTLCPRMFANKLDRCEGLVSRGSACMSRTTSLNRCCVVLDRYPAYRVMDNSGVVVPGATDPDLGEEQCLKIYRTMIRLNHLDKVP